MRRGGGEHQNFAFNIYLEILYRLILTSVFSATTAGLSHYENRHNKINSLFDIIETINTLI